MKRIYLPVLLILLIITSAYSQKENIAIGKNLVSGESIKAEKHVFTDNIRDLHVISSDSIRLVARKGNKSSNLLLYDLSGGNTKWSKKINANSAIYNFKEYTIASTPLQSFAYDTETAKEKWRSGNGKSIYYVNDKEEIGIGYGLTGRTPSLNGVALNNGETVWQRKVPLHSAWHDIIELSDSEVIIVMGGLRYINIKDGAGWDYETYTGIATTPRTYTYYGTYNMSGGMLGGFIGGFMSGVAMNSTMTAWDHPKTKTIGSDVLLDDSYIYFASQEKVSCLDYDGNVKWSRHYNGNIGSESFLFMTDSVVYLVNKGTVSRSDDKQIKQGQPFFAAFRKDTGKDIFSKLLDKKETLNSFYMSEDLLYLIGKDKIMTFSSTDGSPVSEIVFPIEKSESLISFVGNDIYVEDGLTMIPVISSGKADLYLSTKAGDILLLDKELNMKGRITEDELYKSYKEIDGYKFLYKNGITTVIDKENRNTAFFNSSDNVIISDDNLYYIVGPKLLIVDKVDIIGK